MAAKRFFDGDDGDQPNNHKRIKTRPSFASVIKEVVMVNFLENFCSSLEPMLRRVVSEEVENGLRRRSMASMLQCPSLKMIQPPSAAAAALRLAFVKKVSLPIFTGTKITDADGKPLQIILVDQENVPTCLPYAIKVEVVVVDGDFPYGDNKDAFSSDDFSKNIVKERNGKRPLLAGDFALTMRDGVCLVGDLEFTDNSSWIRSRKFRLAARVAAQPHSSAVAVGEAITEAFVVKDHRGELYKKHHPPALGDEVWRLEKIGKGGAFHRKLSSNGINTVQDFLKLYTVDSPKLKEVLGVGMSEKMWEVTLKHAKTCEMGTKMYRCYGNNYTLIFNPICKLINAIIDGQVFHQHDFKNLHMAYIESLVKDAYAKWSSLEELDGITTPLLTQGEVMGPYIPNEHQIVVRSSYGVSDHSMTSSVIPQEESGDDRWPPGFFSTSKTRIEFFSESSSDGDIP